MKDFYVDGEHLCYLRNQCKPPTTLTLIFPKLMVEMPDMEMLRTLIYILSSFASTNTRHVEGGRIKKSSQYLNFSKTVMVKHRNCIL